MPGASTPDRHTIRWHLQQRHGITLSASTIRRILAAGLIEPNPKKRPKSSYIRFEADLPNECWQSDFTHWRLAKGTDIEILAWIDDHSRYLLSLTAHQPVTGPIVVDTFLAAAADHGFPASVLTDNGLVYTTRFAGHRGGRTASRPSSPTAASPRRTPAPTTPPPAARSNASTRPSSAGSPPDPEPAPSETSKPTSTTSS